ncbi:MAG: DUF6499 domain-containing protein [Gammaproteobacteria bacterium]|nr:DUF6499 domain-containing protein [Gammaproteobacteria bacterium]
MKAIPIKPLAEWSDATAYEYTQGHDSALWAWQFLRRNSEYRRDWVQFYTTWQSLEEAYGKAPKRDFSRWKNDPRAYADQGLCEGLEEEAGFGCAGDGGKLLIECWLGAKWGFYKFPLNPEYAQPKVGEELLWREVELQAVRLSVQRCAAYLDSDCTLAFGFDLSLPLKEQLALVKRELQQQKRQQREAIRCQTVQGLAARWLLMLRVLDASGAGIEAAQISAALALDVVSLRNLQQQAEALRDGAYRQMLLLAER